MGVKSLLTIYHIFSAVSPLHCSRRSTVQHSIVQYSTIPIKADDKHPEEGDEEAEVSVAPDPDGEGKDHHLYSTLQYSTEQYRQGASPR